MVAVTGAARGTGRAVARWLADPAHLGACVGIDTEPVAAPGVSWRDADVTDPRMVTSLTGVDAIVHLALDLDPAAPRAAQRADNISGTSVVLTAAAAASVRRVVLVTSAMVYGAQADNPVPLPEDAPLNAVPEVSPLGDLLEIERLAERARRAHPGLDVVVLRPALLVGPDVPVPASGMLDGPRLLFVRGADPHWQFCHVDDLAAAVELAVRARVSGVATVGCEGFLDQSTVEALAGRHRLELSATVAFGTAERLHRVGISPGPASELSYLVHPWVVGSQQLRSVGWRPAYDNADALRSYAQTRPEPLVTGRRVAGAGAAAGATVALVGTAAIVRRARARSKK